MIIDVSDLRRNAAALGKTFSSKEIDRVTARAINEVLMRGRTIARTEVKRVYTVAQRGLDGRIDLDRATAFNKSGKVLKNTFLTGAIIASTTPLPMELFKVGFNPTATSKATFTKRGAKKVSQLKRPAKTYRMGVFIEAVKGRKEQIPYAFMLPTMTSKIFARGKYNPGNGSYGFVQRHKRLSNSSGNDSVKPLLSVTIHAAAINRKVQHSIEDKVYAIYPNTYLRLLNLQFDNYFRRFL